MILYHVNDVIIFIGMLQQGFILVLSCLGVIQALFLCFYLFTVKKGNKRANRFLAFVLLGLTIRIGKSIFHNYIEVDPRIRNVAIATILAVGPFLWFYGKALFEKQQTFSNKQYLHLIPFGLFVLLSPIIPNRGDTASYIAYGLVFVHLGIYLGVCWNYIFKVKDQITPQLLQWYRNIVVGVSVVWVLYVGILLRWIPFYILGAISFSFLMYLFTYLLLKRHVFALEKYSNSTIDRLTSKKVLKKAKKLLVEDEIFLQNDVSLNNVAKQLEVTPRELSQVINENEQKNFSEFVNHYRIQKAKALLVDPKYVNEKIATIAYDCGFGNVTSFNLVFKAETEITPSQYRNRFKVA
ncbi:helix-turn-helix transcriptional regulator [Aquimarina gracilis]|uniref:Helix-turn-helix transcriptional regulator n=1 Tax=Aquimarina gracilis TaxID=874422 RepID=A0ABU5ZZA3_9FLAO|nr:helix-turn-helix transcriptional regulator [Aquimarina gracilis]MEB3347186.1 helix-turn-helix transcriptional regulator [Aquimarina gracilis]